MEVLHGVHSIALLPSSPHALQQSQNQGQDSNEHPYLKPLYTQCCIHWKGGLRSALSGLPIMSPIYSLALPCHSVVDLSFPFYVS